MAGDIIYKHVRRRVFMAMADLVDAKYRLDIRVNYNGNNLYGDVTIEFEPGHSNVYKKVVDELAEIVISNS